MRYNNARVKRSCNQGGQHAGKGKHYVIGDVHGCYEDFFLPKEKIEKRDPEATIILTGDFLIGAWGLGDDAWLGYREHKAGREISECPGKS